MNISLEGQAVVVTGGAVRLGRAIALACARAGADVAITYSTSEKEALSTLEELREFGGKGARFAVLHTDVSCAHNIKRLPDEVLSTLGKVTALVNNAAIFRRTPFESLTEADFDAHINTNLKGPFLLCKAFGDIFMEQKSGSIVNLADIYGIRPLKNYVPYCLSKAGVVMLTQTLALALAPQVRVNCVCPGTILPPSETQNENDEAAQLVKRIPMQRLGTPDEIAQTVVFLLGGPTFITGAVIPVDGAQILR